MAPRNFYPWYSFPSSWLFANCILGSKEPVNEALTLYFTNRQQFSMHCTLIDHRNVAKMFKTQAEPRAAGEWCHCKVWNILTSFLRSITEQTVENCCRFIVYNNIDNFEVHFRCPRERKKQTNKKTNCATITLFLWSVLLSNIALDKSARENRSVMVKYLIIIPMLRWFLFRHQTDPRRLLSTNRDPESNFWWIASYGNVFASLSRFVEFREMLEERAVCFIDCNCVLNYAALMPRSVVVWTDDTCLHYFASSFKESVHYSHNLKVV